MLITPSIDHREMQMKDSNFLQGSRSSSNLSSKDSTSLLFINRLAHRIQRMLLAQVRKIYHQHCILGSPCMPAIHNHDALLQPECQSITQLGFYDILERTNFMCNVAGHTCSIADLHSFNLLLTSPVSTRTMVNVK